MHTTNRVQTELYLDSVALMRMSTRIAAMAGVQDASLMIGTVSNKRLLEESGLLTDAGREAGSNDLIIAVKADTEAAAGGAVAAALEGLAGGATTTAHVERRPRSIGAACATLREARLALISVPGEFAAHAARQALAQGLHVMIFSDNVPLEQERALKMAAREQRLLVMGPDCGTALVCGVPLGFANEVPQGAVGAVAASGTGLQELSVLLANAGYGLSHGIGVGGRDLSDEVGGVSTLAALDALDADAATERIVLISKPPGPRTALLVLDRLSRSTKPSVVCFLGVAERLEWPANVQAAATVRAAARLASGHDDLGADAEARDAARTARGRRAAGRRWIRGLFSGGTLCAEAQVIVRDAGLAVHSNAPIPGAAGDAVSAAHLLLDLGADEYTLGRPHPMLEPSVRDHHLARALADDSVAVVLLDVILGYGAHTDPAGAVAAVMRSAGPRRPAVVASLCGTRRDVQGYDRQLRTLTEVGVVVAASNAQAAELALDIVG